jgi:hypothetical protein
MPIRQVIGTAVDLGRRAVGAGLDAAGTLRGRDDSPAESSPAPKPGEPGGPKSGTASRTPAQAANGAAATPRTGPVPTGRATPRRKAAAKRPATRAKAKKPARKPAARKPAAKQAKPAAAKREPAATANGAGAQDKPGAVPTGQAVRSTTPSA